MSLEKLLEDVGALAKSQTVDAEAEAAAAAAAVDAAAAAAGAGEAAADAGAGAGEGGEGGEVAIVGAGADAPLAKSFSLMLEDGTELEAFDGAELIKSFGDRLDKTQADTEAALTGALQIITAQGEMLKSQSTLLKSLSGQVEALAASGRGRKSTVVMPGAAAPEAKPATAQMNPGQVLAKCLSLQGTGRLTGLQVSRAEIAVTNGQPVPADIAAALAE